MIADKVVELLENSAVKLTVTVAKERVKKEHDALIGQYLKTIKLKGFRKGKVPRSVLLQKYGDSLVGEATVKIIDDSLAEVLKGIEQKPLPYNSPQLEGDPKLDLEKEFTYTVTFDTYPDFEIKTYTGLEIETPTCAVAKKDIDGELEILRQRNAMVIEKKDGVVAKDDIVNIDYEEVDSQGLPIIGTKGEDFTFPVGSGHNLYKLDDDIIGLKPEEEKIIAKQFPADFDNADIAGTSKKIKVKINSVKEKKLPDLDDELAKDVSEKYQTLEDLRKAIKKDLTKNIERALSSRRQSALIDAILEPLTIDLPKSMVNAELEDRWRGFLRQSRLDEATFLAALTSEGKSKDDILSEWRSGAEKDVKKALVIGKLMELEKIEISQEDFEKEVARQAEESGVKTEEMKNYLAENKMESYFRSNLREKQLFDRLFDQNTIKSGKKQSYAKLIGHSA